ncbi:phosphopantothenoylcysteine decarboxylase/phosphopantothenate--cysteine ligase [Algoriphagus boseongensis]|uniref:Coenzyme A biosynthesis bifunctional protein CoaBC n=1 Tax=Algoriphagus boseongensis TaxID=1442587 RepID=A0A4R6T2E4_9BACT|nr:bifunctional phosphopantothenoylcysteine decarboxylase/phosphopantothenate--cysteine ligase CoaBC [Algoriphagus boseongensis]TDQ14771.1 phosphopantothenoylcysteine decarboxylase/phosphopantothenate--cysteine ligase [Algoriphagus boseongensis]
MNLKGKRILLGVTGSIAAYKSALLTRLLIKSGAEVQIIMSASALDFITPLTLSTLSKNPVHSEFSNKKTGEWTNHVELGLWADLFIVAPASANTLGKFANGICDNLLTATYLSARCPVMVAPAMDLDMYQHPSVKNNLKKLSSFGNIVLEAESGELASGLSGQGRMMEPEHILAEVFDFFSKKNDFSGRKVLITLGPTQEAIDPVRFISNHSSGKMGFAIAKAFQQRGAEVFVIAGPVALDLSQKGFQVTHVSSAKEMYAAAAKLHANIDICVFSAAVADYAPLEAAPEKIKKQDAELTLKMVKNVDIAFELGKLKRQNQIHVGFALETENEEFHAKAKLDKKNFDLIVLNSAREEGAGFRHDTNRVKIFHRDGKTFHSELALKSEIAELILDEVKKAPVWI